MWRSLAPVVGAFPRMTRKATPPHFVGLQWATTARSPFPLRALYSAYRDQRPCWPLIGTALVLGSIALGGILLNLSVILVTCRFRTLRGSANYLLALCSLFELLHQQGHFLFVFTALSGQNFVDLRLAAHICALSFFGLGGIGTVMLLTGLDRLFVVLFPMSTFLDTHLRLYLVSATALCSLSGLMGVWQLYTNVAASPPHMLVTGCIGDFLQLNGDFNTFYTTYEIGTFALVLVYVLVGVLIRRQSTHTANNSAEINRRIFRSLAIIISVSVGGYSLLGVHYFLVRPRLSSELARWFLGQTIGVPVNLSAASNGPILYWTSTEYRKAYRTELACVLKVFRGNATVHSSLSQQGQGQQSGQQRREGAGARTSGQIVQVG